MMARTRPPYAPEFRREAIRLSRAGDRSPELAERRRSRTYQRMGYMRLPVLKTAEI